MELSQLTAVIMGPTGSGKSRLALDTARKFGGEIVSFDSMQLYRGLEIGTAQPTAAEKTVIPHHLVGIKEIEERADVFEFLQLAERAVAEIRGRGHLPILCGGTGLYLKAFLYGIDDIPGDRTLRQELDALYDAPEKEEALCARLKNEDPESLERFGACRRRMIRALEVKLLTGKSIIELQNASPRKLREGVCAFKLELTPEALDRKLAVRTRKMLESGWIEEAKAALERGLLETPTARQAIGYALIGEYLAERITLADLPGKIVTATRQYARRQRTWFRHQHPEALPISPDTDFLPLEDYR